MTKMNRYMQRRTSYKGFIPSEDMREDYYMIYLEVAPPFELENDIVSPVTMSEMIRRGAYCD